MRRWLGVALAIAGVVAAGLPAAARRQPDDEDDEEAADGGDDDDRGDDDDDRGDDDEGDGDDRGDGDDDEGDDAGVRASREDASDDGDASDGGDAEPEEDFDRQKDHNRPGGGRSDQNQFQKERFFVDKEESAKTAKGTLVQGSLTSSSFVYRESGGALGGMAGLVGVTSDSQFARYFTDLRGQLDAMHLGGSRWDFRIDGRIRLTADPGQATTDSVDGTDFGTRVQSGLFGRNEYDLKELWLVRGGERADVFIGRQYVADLGAIKIDGVRIDYASSPRFTIIAFGGAYPYRGSRSIGLDYIEGRDETNQSVGRVIPIAGGAGAAYRTEHMYGSFGGVAIVPLKGEQPRVYGTASGYWRTGPKLDFYHFAVLDLYGSAGFALTNLSAGINVKPAPRIRLNAAVNRVDTETLNVTAQASLNNPEPGVIRNDTTIQRVASDQARGGISVSLGQTQQIEVSTSMTYRRRPEVKLSDGTTVLQTLAASSSAEVLFQLLHRNLRGFRVGFDGSRIFKLGGGAAYARSASFTGRLFVARELARGRGEWQVEAAYTSAKDENVGVTCSTADLETCYGSSKIGLVEVGGTVYYRLRDDLFGVAMLNVGRYSSQAVDLGETVTDEDVASLSGFLRLAYRF